MKRPLFTLALLLAALGDRLRGRRLAVNSTPDVITVGIPDDVDRAEVQRRTNALILAGTDPIYAEKLAITAAQQQALRDHQQRATVTTEEVPLTKTVTVVSTGPDAAALEGMTIAQLREHAATARIDLGTATLRADLLAAIKAATPTS